MLVEFVDKTFPIVMVKLKGTMTDDKDFINFTTTWMGIYKNKRDFIFILDTDEFEYADPKYAILIADFIKKLKKYPKYLKISLIYMSNKLLLELLNITFMIQPPINDVYLINVNVENKDELINILETDDINKNYKIIDNFLKTNNIQYKYIESSI